MPHASEDGGAAGEDACSSDELIVFKDENGGEDVVKRSSDKVTEEKSDLIDLSESEKVSSNHRCSPVKTSSSTSDLNRSKPGPTPHPPAFNMGYLVAPYPSPYTNGTTSVSMMSSYLESQRDPLTVSPHFLYCLFKNGYFLVQTILISVFIFSYIPCAIRK